MGRIRYRSILAGESKPLEIAFVRRASNATLDPDSARASSRDNDPSAGSSVESVAVMGLEGTNEFQALLTLLTPRVPWPGLDPTPRQIYQ